MTSVLIPAERRSNRRFALNIPLRYRAANSPLRAAWKRGGVLNMSAGGILIDIPEPVGEGMKLELAMEWTGLYHGRQSMRLFLIAKVTRLGSEGTALRILSARFRDAAPTRVRPAGTRTKLAVA